MPYDQQEATGPQYGLQLERQRQADRQIKEEHERQRWQQPHPQPQPQVKQEQSVNAKDIPSYVNKIKARYISHEVTLEVPLTLLT